jgi:iron only hydrogenase large subunit-like protein
MKPKVTIAQIVGTEECIPCNQKKQEAHKATPENETDIYKGNVTWGEFVEILRRNNLDPLTYDKNLSEASLRWVNQQLTK